MATFDLNVSKFPAQYNFDPEYDVRIWAVDIIRHIMTAGSANLSHRHKWSPEYVGWLGHMAEGTAQITQTGSGMLRVTHGSYSFERTQQGAVSQWLGIALTKHVMEVMMNVDHLIWVDRVDDVDISVKLKTPRPKKRGPKPSPDMIGKDDNGDWHVVEAKGRWATPSKTKQQLFKKQANSLLSITETNAKGGLTAKTTYAPTTHSVCLCVTNSKWCRVHWWDPEPEPNDNLYSVELNSEKLIRSYYSGVRMILQEAERSDKSEIRQLSSLEYQMAPISLYNQRYWIGMPLLMMKRPEVIYDMQGLFREHPRLRDEIPDEQIRGASLGTDGIVVVDRTQPDWQNLWR